MSNRISRHKRPGFFRVITILVLAAVGIVGVFAWQNATTSKSSESVQSYNDLTFKVMRGEFVSLVTEPGDLSSSSNTDIKCRVKSLGRSGTTILKIVPEGTMVTAGTELCQLDDSTLQDQLIQQKIKVARDDAEVIQAESDLNAAKQVLEEFQNGTYDQQRSTIEAEVAIARENLERATEYLRYSQQLNAKGYVSDIQKEADEFAVEKASKEVDNAEKKLFCVHGLYQRPNDRRIQGRNSQADGVLGSSSLFKATKRI